MAKEFTIGIRVSAGQLEELARCANLDGESTASWVRQAALSVARERDRYASLRLPVVVAGHIAPGE